MIKGGGIAAYCSAFLLKKAGFRVEPDKSARAKLPALLLSDAALALMRDVFEQPDLFAGLPRIQRRVVAWERNSPPMEFEHSAVIVSEKQMLDDIRSRFEAVDAEDEIDHDWTIIASHPLPAGCDEHRFGTRTGFVAPVKLIEDAAPPSCWIESTENGWLFLIENGPGDGWLLAIGGKVESLLERSSLIQKRITQCGEPSGEVPTYPRIAAPLSGPDWLVCGSAAMAFDPICGDGTAHAMREAILAAAVIRAATAGAGAETSALLSHYETRLLAGFKRHLALCTQFYSRAHPSPWWDAESAALTRGLAWCDQKLAESPAFRYRLEGFELRPIA